MNTLGKMDPGLRLDDALRGDDRRRDGSGLTDQDEAVLPPLPDETISSNQRLATALTTRRIAVTMHVSRKTGMLKVYRMRYENMIGMLRHETVSAQPVDHPAPVSQTAPNP